MNNAQAIADLKTDVDKLSDTDPIMAAQINEGISRLTSIQNLELEGNHVKMRKCMDYL